MAIEFHLSGGAGNSNPSLSLGGATGAVMATAALNNLFGNVAIGDANPKYRAISLKCATIAHLSVLFWVPANTTSPGTDLMGWFEGKNLGSPVDHTGSGEEDATNLGTFAPYDGLIVREAACQAGGASSVTLDAACALTSAQVVGYVLEMVSGRSRDQRRRVTAYDTGTKVATLDSNWVTTPAAGERFRLERKYLVGDAAAGDDFRFWLKRTQETAMGESLYDSAMVAAQWWK